LNAQVAFAPLVHQLNTPDGRLPTLREFANFIAAVLRQYVHARQSFDAACGCAVLGTG
jgi:hypothetical protein